MKQARHNREGAVLELAVKSSAGALKATEMGYQLGTRTVLDAEEQRFRANST